MKTTFYLTVLGTVFIFTVILYLDKPSRKPLLLSTLACDPLWSLSSGPRIEGSCWNCWCVELWVRVKMLKCPRRWHLKQLFVDAPNSVWHCNGVNSGLNSGRTRVHVHGRHIAKSVYFLPTIPSTLMLLHNTRQAHVTHMSRRYHIPSFLYLANIRPKNKTMT